MKKEDSIRKTVAKLLKTPSFAANKRDKSSIPTGLPGLDSMLSKGIKPGNVITISGEAGSGRTSFGLWLAVKSDKKRLIISFEESEEQLSQCAERFGLNIRKETVLRVLPAFIPDIGGFLEDLGGLITIHKPQVCVFNSVETLNTSAGGEKNEFLSALIAILRHNSVTAVFVCGRVEKEQEVLPALWNNTDLCLNLENESETESAPKLLKILKYRNGSFDGSPAELELSGKELSVRARAGKVLKVLRKKEKEVNVLFYGGDTRVNEYITEQYGRLYPGVRLNLHMRDSQGATLDDVIGKTEVEFDTVMGASWELKNASENGLLYDVSEYFRYSAGGSFYKNTLDECSLKGAIFAMPFYIECYNFLLRHDLFAKHKIGLPISLEEFAEKANLLLKLEKTLKSGLLYNGSNRDAMLPVFAGLQSALYRKNLTVEEGLLRARAYEPPLKFINDCIYKFGIVPPDIAKMDHGRMVEEYNGGRALALCIWNSVYSELVGGKSRFVEGTIQADFPREGSPFSIIRVMGFGVPHNARNPLSGIDFMKMMCDREVNRRVFGLGNFNVFSALKDTNIVLEEEKKSGFYFESHKHIENSPVMKEIYRDTALLDIIFDLTKRAAEKNMKPGTLIALAQAGLGSFQKAKIHGRSIESAKRFMDANFSRKLSREEIARSAGLSYSYLAGIFKKAEKETIMGYLLKVRMGRAKKLLLDDYTQNIAQVARNSGFADNIHFSKVFKEQAGSTPKEFRSKSRV